MKPIQQAWGANRGRECAWDDCTKPARRRGLCQGHYDRLVNPPKSHAVLEPLDADAPADCQCDVADRLPERCLLAGVVPIPGAYQCARCFKRLDESLVS